MVGFFEKRTGRAGLGTRPSVFWAAPVACALFALLLWSAPEKPALPAVGAGDGEPSPLASMMAAVSEAVSLADELAAAEESAVQENEGAESAAPDPETLRLEARAARAALVEPALKTDFRAQFVHGDKDADHTRWIMVHDTADTGNGGAVIKWWAGNGREVAAHFIIDRDGTIWQCVPLDKIAHHAGYGDAGHNEAFGVTEDGRDDMHATVALRNYPDYGMNAWSIGIELVHVAGQEGGYPEAQLIALDNLIAYIDEWCGFECPITIHREWRTSNVDTSPEFDPYLANYRDHRTHTDG